MKQFLRNNGFLILVAAVLLTAVLAVGWTILGGDPIAEVVGIVSAPFRNLSTAAARWVEEQYDRAFRYDALEQENEALRQRIAELEQAGREGEDASRERDRLRDLLGLAERRADLVYEQAEITQRSASSWQSQVTLNRGSKQGVAVNNCVVDQYGNLMGVVVEVDYNSCIMSTILDPDVELGGRVARTDGNAILEGDFSLMLEGRLKLSYLPEDSELISGDQVTTSGLGQIYPSGLLVGYIESIHTEANGLDRYAVVRPASELEQQRYVFIIKDFDIVE